MPAALLVMAYALQWTGPSYRVRPALAAITLSGLAGAVVLFLAARSLYIGRVDFVEGGKWRTVVGEAPSLERDGNFVMQPNRTAVRR